MGVDLSARERIHCARGDLTQENVDAIVNAANATLGGGGGVDGAIHRAAGPGLLAECAREHPGGCPTGEVRVTGGHDLAARYVIHAVGPVWRGGERGEPALLASCYGGALDAAAGLGLASISFPAISCGVYGYPPEDAAVVALTALSRGLARHPSIERARVVLFSEELLAVWRKTHGELAARAPGAEA